MQPKIKIKLPEALPRAIPSEDVQRLLEVITTVRDRALILLLLRTGMRIGELLEVDLDRAALLGLIQDLYTASKNNQAVLPGWRQFIVQSV